MEATVISQLAMIRSKAETYMPAGVSAGGRFNPSLGHTLYAKRADGPRIWDIDDKSYLDFNLAHGACLLGHNHPAIKRAIEVALNRGLTAGYETEETTCLAKKIVDIIPCAEKVRLANSGSEGTELTLRLARGFTGKKKIIKFWGHFHGMYDYVMYNAHSPLTPLPPGRPVPLSREGAGIPAELDGLLIVLPWNDEAALKSVVREQGDQIAGIIMEPINYNQGCIVATKPYMQLVRQLASENNIVLIYDEVLSGFRTGSGCAQEYYGVTPDLCVLAKALSNGVPLAAVAGRAEIMDSVSPHGHVAHSGTTVGNLLSVMAAQAALKEITSSGFYDHIYKIADQFYKGMNEIFVGAGIPARVQGLGARFGIYFGFTEEVKTFADTLKHDSDMMARFIRAAANRGVYFHSYGNLVRGHHGISSAHTQADIQDALDRIETAVHDIKQGLA
jgi:glutamate-1-semialdehyde 2,1-aminomutase